jgi:hypothetical protein
MTRRWEEDERGIGVARGDAFAPGVDGLLATMRADGWVAEQPEAHLLPHIRRWCEKTGRFRILGERSEDAVYIVELEWTAPDEPFRELRADVFALVGTFAESSTHVRQRTDAGAVEYDVTTGMLEDETPFHTHGHLVRLRISGEQAVRAAR